MNLNDPDWGIRDSFVMKLVRGHVLRTLRIVMSVMSPRTRRPAEPEPFSISSSCASSLLWLGLENNLSNC